MRAIFAILTMLFMSVFAQDYHGDARYRARNIHSGNLIRVTFHNHGMLGGIKGDNSLIYAGEWPINSGMVQMGNASSYVTTQLRVFAGVDSTGDSTYANITPVVFSQGWDPNRFSHDSLGKFLGFEPLPGYYNLAQKESNPHEAVAMSHQAFTWPASWPDKVEDALDPGWSGHWNGYFGKDQKNADQESYYVTDDYQFTKKIQGIPLPLPIAADPNRGGLGLRQQVRGLQWSNPDAEDCIFWIYNIRNFGELDLHKTVFGLNVGASIGARMGANTDYDDDCAEFYRETGLTVNFDWDNVGTAGYSPVPWAGFAFLESPGNAVDGIDNDGDGIDAPGGGKLIESSDFIASYDEGDDIVLINYNTYERTVTQMPADGISFNVNGTTYLKVSGAVLEEIPRNGIDDNLNGVIDESDGAMAQDSVYYYLYIRNPVYNDKDYLCVDYFSGNGLDNAMIDERRDDGVDNDGDWDVNTDDVGLDGKPGTGDPGEGDGVPTPGFGNLPGEPNIDITDVDESDQIGLTSFIFYIYGSITYSNDQEMWDVSRPGYFDGTLTNVDADYIFSCGYFPLMSQQSEYFSVAMIYGWDRTDIIKNKDIVQKIYDTNYNFAVAPEKPKVWAVPGDRKVTIYWDDSAEQSFDRYLKTYDFEGYKIYRATDPGFQDAGAITDGYGYDRFTKPLAIYDKVDSVYGFFPNTFGRGVQFNLGSETGLTHTYIDSPLVNGKRYFYAVTAYDKGDLEKNISPSETNKYIAVDASGNVKTGENVVAIIPRVPSLGYVPPGFETAPSYVGTGLTTGKVAVRYVEPDSIFDGEEFEIRFLDQSMDKRDNDLDSLIDGEDPDEFLPTLTTGFVVENLTRSEIVDTVWFFDYKQVGSEWVMIRNLYEDNDANPRTLRKVVQGIEYFVYNPAPGIIHLPEEKIYNGIQWSDNLDYLTAYRLNFGVFNLGGFQPGIDYPRQYRIVFYDEIVGQSETIYPILQATGTPIPVPARDVNFKIFDQQTGEELRFGFVDAAVDLNLVQPGYFSAKDRIIFVETLPDSSTVITMSLLNNAVEDTTFYNWYGRLLGSGDTLNLYPDFSFNYDSKFRFTTRGQKIDTDAARKNLDEIRVVPNPYVVTASWEPQNPYTSGRGPRAIHFINLPKVCTIRIFAVDGALVRKIEHNSTDTNGYEVWDVLTKDNMELAYGVYIYHIEAQGIGEKVGRMLIIK
ncbi:MAG: hypothetical protein KAU06_00595 [Candidatus Marinimicrobia bacterium]|nr:hypothetical protein [Candidatus Neomarinimicrobiota bacterium]